MRERSPAATLTPVHESLALFSATGQGIVPRRRVQCDMKTRSTLFIILCAALAGCGDDSTGMAADGGMTDDATTDAAASDGGASSGGAKLSFDADGKLVSLDDKNAAAYYEIAS